VSGTERRLGPLQESDVASRRAGDCFAHSLQSGSVVVDQLFRCAESFGGSADSKNIFVDLRQVARGEREDSRWIRQVSQRAHELISRWGANLTEILGEDNVGPQLLEQHLIHLVKALASSQMRRDRGIDLLLGFAFECECGFADYREGPDVWREIAFMGATHELFGGTERARDFCSSGEEADDSHSEIYIIRTEASPRRASR